MRNLPIKTQDRMLHGHDNLGTEYVHLLPNPQGPQKTDALRAYVNILRRRKWYIITPVVLIIPLIILSINMAEPTYRASSRLLIESRDARILDIESVMNPGNTESFYLTEYQMIRSEENITEVVNALGLDQKVVEKKEEFAAQLGHLKKVLRRAFNFVKNGMSSSRPSSDTAASSPATDPAALRRQAAINAFARSLLVLPQQDGRLVDIIITGLTPQEVAQQANTLAEVYARKNLEKKQEADTNAIALLTKQMDDLRENMLGAEIKLQQFRKKEGIGFLDSEEKNSMVMANLQRLHQDYNNAKRARADIEERLNNLRVLSRRDLSSLKTIPSYIDPHMIGAIMNLRNQYQALTIQRSNHSQLYKERHPTMTRLEAQLSQVRRAMEAEFRKAMTSLQAEYDVRLAREQALEKELAAQKDDSMHFKNDMITHDALKRDAEGYRNLYREASERLREIKLTQASTINNVKIVKRATVPLGPVPAKFGMKLFSSIFLAGCLGIGCAFIREYVDNRFKEADEVGPFLQIPFLGVVPHYTQGKGRAYEPVSLREPSAIASEAYRILRTRIQAAAPRLQTLLVTSALPSEGKSTTTANLGIAFARLGLRVLLVDVDLRRPSLHRHFWISNSEGLATVLVDGGEWQQFLQDTPMTNLKILPTGFNTHHPSDLLSLESTKKLLEQFKHTFDLVIFDGPIVLSIPDVEIIAPGMDGVIVVHCPERCDKSSVLNAKTLLERVAANILGIVFNNIRRQDQKYYYQQRNYYAQNLYAGAEQYDIGSSAIKRVEATDLEPASAVPVVPDGHGVADAHGQHVYEEGVAVRLDRIIINDTVAGESTEDSLTFLVLELQLCNTSSAHSVMVFRPEAAIIRFEVMPDDIKEILHCDRTTAKIQNGLQGDVALLAQETKKGLLAFRIPRGVPHCRFEYGAQRVDITIGL